MKKMGNQKFMQIQVKVASYSMSKDAIISSSII